jgi:tagaturonate reductase
MGFTILPTELINNNADTLKEICLKLAKENSLEDEFIRWLTDANQFCNTLVDRIVPGKIAQAEEELKSKFDISDELLIMSEPYALWAIQSTAPIVKERLSFAQIHPGVIITPDIDTFRILKLHLLNGTHTFSCGVAILSGFITVDEAIKNELFFNYIKQLIYQEIAPAISSETITLAEAERFATKVLSRFNNSNIKHKWSAITLQYSTKMRWRNLPVLLKFIN